MLHPGELIAEELQLRGMSGRECARRLGVTHKCISNILNGRARVTVRVALKLEPVLGTPARIWINLQMRHDLAKARARYAAL